MYARKLIGMRTKYAFASLVGLAIAGAGFVWILRTSFAEKSEEVWSEFALSTAKQMSHALETRIEGIVSETQTFAHGAIHSPKHHGKSSHHKEHNGPFDLASHELNDVLISLSLYPTSGSMLVPTTRLVNWDRVRELGMSSNFFKLLQSRVPLEPGVLKHNEHLQLYNRTVKTFDGEIVPILTLVFRGRGEGSAGYHTLFMAELDASRLYGALKHEKLGRLTLYKANGSVVLSSLPTVSFGFALKPYSTEIREVLDRTHDEGEFIVSSHGAHASMTTVLETSIGGAFSALESPMPHHLSETRNAEIQALMALVLGFCSAFFFISWFAGRTRRHIERLAFALRSTHPEVPWVKPHDELARLFQAVHDRDAQFSFAGPKSHTGHVPTTGPQLTPGKVLRFPPQKLQAPGATILRNTAESEGAGLLFFDVSHSGPTVRVIQLRPEGNPEACLMMHKAISGSVADLRPSQGATKPFGEVLSQFNQRLHSEFSGKAWMSGTVIEFSSETGATTVFALGAEFPVTLPAGPANAEKSASDGAAPASLASLGLRAESQFAGTALSMKKGETLTLFTAEPTSDPTKGTSTAARNLIRDLFARKGNTNPDQVQRDYLASPEFQKLRSSASIAFVTFAPVAATATKAESAPAVATPKAA